MTTKDDLHRLIDALPDSKIEDAARDLRVLCWGDSLDQEEDADGMTAADRAWLESDLSRLEEYEPYDWGDEGLPATVNPIRHVPGQGLMVFLDEQVPVRRDQ